MMVSLVNRLPTVRPRARCSTLSESIGEASIGEYPASSWDMKPAIKVTV